MLSLQDAIKNFVTPQRLATLKSLTGVRGPHRFMLRGLSGSASAMVMAAIPAGKSPALILADCADEAGYIYSDLAAMLGDTAVHFFPSGYKRSIRYGQPDAPAQILRTETLAAIGVKSTRFVVTYPEALAEMVPAPKSLDSLSLTLTKGEHILLSAATARLADLGFVKVDYVYEPGQYSVRGSLLDVFSYSHELPFRIDFFDDEIDSLRTFNVETQLSEQQLDEVRIMAPDAGSHDDMVSLISFMGPRTLLLARDPLRALGIIKEMTSQSLSASAQYSGEADTEAMQKLVNYDSFEHDFKQLHTGVYGISPAYDDPEAPVLDFVTSPQGLFHKNFELISQSFGNLISQGYTIYILSDSATQFARLRAIFSERGDDIPFTPLMPTLHEGFSDPLTKSCYFTDHQIFDRFHKYNLRSERARSGKVALSLKELSQIEPGDYIVHIDHGVGRFGGLVRTDVAGRPQEMIKLVYAGDDIIFCSIHALHKLSKYRGKEGVPPKINKLGTGAWQRVKDRTKAKMKDIARDLIKLYAARGQEKGFAFSPDTYLQHELEASFVYEDTPDQVTATAAVKADMESPRPMDRLICGDVGFGKTEIAIRAAFKAAVDGKQTAVLVPTTVLAMQHYHTFADRLRDLPVRVDFISRARKPADVKRLLADLADGKIDILIGTHKIIGKSVKFKDLGLLIVDEEQKFGVSVKEKLRSLKVNVDTLTMSATPIPRTLQFSLMGARDLSNLTTPPANRHPILTSVSLDDDDIVVEAVNFEVSRGGQVFYICNRIERLSVLENRLKRLVPDVRVVTAHGQMPPDNLERAIVDFADGQYDVLLSTTIVESGIDMPNVNTIIVDNAQNFGLSELHQLRGRVGRSSRKAFAYLLTPPGKPLTEVARRRLQAIESFSDLGAGIHIAMQDLDIRGAGNLLGAEQSGFIADLGYETYQKILRESVAELKAEEFAGEFADTSTPDHAYVSDCTIESDLELRLPPEYVPQEGERIALYQELDNITDQAGVDEFRSRLIDRFGPLPEVTEELLRIPMLRRVARSLGIERLNMKQGNLYLYFTGDENKAYYQSPAFGRVLAWLQTHPQRCRLRQNQGKRSIVVERVRTTSGALKVLDAMRMQDPV